MTIPYYWMAVVGWLAVSAAPPMAAAEAGGASAGGWLVVANKGDRTLGLVDPAAGREVATIPEEGVTGHEVAVSPDGQRAFVPIYGDSGVGARGSDGRWLRVVDLAARRIVGTVDFGRGVRPHCVVVGPKNQLLYVTTELANCVTMINPRTLQIVGTIPTGQRESHMLAISRDGRRGYTANVGPGTVSVLDLARKKLVAVLAIAPEVQRIALSADDRWAFTADQSQPRIAVIDTAGRRLHRWIPLPSVGYGMAATRDGRWLLVALSRANQVAVVDLQEGRVARTLAVPAAPQEVLVRPDGAVAYVSCDRSHQVAALDLGAWKVAGLIEAGGGVDGLAWARGH